MTADQLARFPFSAFPLSVRVDLLRLFAECTRVVRCRVCEGSSNRETIRWAAHCGLTVEFDDDRYVAVGRDQGRVRRLLEIDASPEPHEAELGRMLGYPVCCADRVAVDGECAINRLAQKAAVWHYEDRFRLIDTADYPRGRALISHLPCTPHCEASLRLAEQALAQLNTLELSHYETLRVWAAQRGPQTCQASTSTPASDRPAASWETVSGQSSDGKKPGDNAPHTSTMR
jgi:hypothetical protein